MSYYPILQAPNCEGWTTLCNFAPNNWERVRSIRRYANVSWTDEGVWRHRTLSEIEPNGLQRFCSSELSGFLPKGATAFLSLSQVRLPEKSFYFHMLATVKLIILSGGLH